MKKIILLVCVIFLSSLTSIANADVLKAKALCHVSTENPPETLTVRIINRFRTPDGITLSCGYVLMGTMQDIVQPDKWCKNASFSYKIDGYIDAQDKYHALKDSVVITYRQKLEPDLEHSEISVMGQNDSGITFSPRTFTRIKESSSVGDNISKFYNENAPWRLGKQINIKPNELIFFNY